MLRGLIVTLALLGLSGCWENIDVGDLCHPTAPECADFDWDGDGVVNSEDKFPADASCYAYTNENCLGCAIGCAPFQFCDGEGQCTCHHSWIGLLDYECGCPKGECSALDFFERYAGESCDWGAWQEGVDFIRSVPTLNGLPETCAVACLLDANCTAFEAESYYCALWLGGACNLHDAVKRPNAVPGYPGPSGWSGSTYVLLSHIHPPE